MADPQSIIGSDPADMDTKADAWDIYHKSANVDEFEKNITNSKLSNDTKAKLWDLKNTPVDAHEPSLDERIGAKSYGDIWSDPTTGVLKKVLQTGVKGQNEMGHGTADFVSGLPGMVSGAAHAMMPSNNIPIPGGTGVEEAGSSLKKAYDLAQTGQFSEAAKALPVVGGMYDYATNHPIMQTAGALLTGEAFGGLTKKGADWAGKMPEPPKTILGATPSVRSVIGVLKPKNAIKAVDEYPDVMARLKAEDPKLGEPDPDFLNRLRSTLNAAMVENRSYYEGHVGPLKNMGMQVDLGEIGKSMKDAITPKLKLEDPEGVASLEKIIDRYNTKTSLSDLENMLQETNAQTRAINTKSSGAASQAIRASETKAILDAQSKSFRKVFYGALDNFNVGDDVKGIQREYGKMLGFKLDAEQLYNKVLRKSEDPKPGFLGQAANFASNVITGQPVKTLAQMAKQTITSGTDDIATLQKAFKDFKGQAPAYPTPPVQAPGGRLQLPAPTTKLPGNGPSGSAPAPQGTPPPGMGPSAAYPTNQKALPAPTTKMGGDTYGPGGQGPVVSAEQLPPMPPAPPSVGMFKVQGDHGPEYITHEERIRRLAAQKGR